MPIQPAISLLLETRARWQVPNEIRPERPIPALRAAVELAKTICPGAVLRSITATCNCVGMVLASRRVWVDPEHLVRILREDGYRRLPGPDEAEEGDVVIYHDEGGALCHVGVVARKQLLVSGTNREPLVVLSKWGADGEYLHGLSEVPQYLGHPAELWTERKSA